MGLEEPSVWDRLGWQIVEPLLQKQDSSNRRAQQLLHAAEKYDVPYEKLPGRDGEKRFQAPAGPRALFERLYNPVGRLLLDVSLGSFPDYAMRVADLEGRRRVALLAAQLRADDVSRATAEQKIRTSDIANPYTSEPFTWDASSGEIVFHGLVPNARAEYRLTY